jgi:hypothetical protein
MCGTGEHSTSTTKSGSADADIDIEVPDGDDPDTPDPDDPLGLTEEGESTTPTEPSTRSRGIPPPPAIEYTTPPKFSPEVTRLKTSGKWLTQIPLAASADKTTSQSVDKAKALAVGGRDSYVDVWRIGRDVNLTAAKLKAADDAVAGQVISTIEPIISNDGALVDALQRWTEERTKNPADLTALADAADIILKEVERLAKLVDREGMANWELPISCLGDVLRGIAKAVGEEAQLIVTGKELPANPPGEAVARFLSEQTGDGEFTQHINNTDNWKNAGKKLVTALRTVAPGAYKSGHDLVAMERVMSALSPLDKARQARGTKTDPASQRSVFDAYLAVVAELQGKVAILQDALGPNPTPEASKALGKMNLVEAGRARDHLLLMLRVIRDAMATDSISTDSTVKNDVKATIDKINATGFTGTEAEAASLLGKSFRKFWQTARDTQLGALKRQKVPNIDVLSKSFDQGLGPLLDKWASATAKFPARDREALHDLAVQINTTLSTYRATVMTSFTGSHQLGLLHGLDVLAAGIALTIRSRANTGGLFG